MPLAFFRTFRRINEALSLSVETRVILGDRDVIDLEKILILAGRKLCPIDTRQSTTPNLANSSYRKLIVTSVVGFLYLRTSGHLKNKIK